MSDRIRGRPPGAGDVPLQPEAENEASTASTQKGKAAPKTPAGGKTKASDTFARGGPSAAGAAGPAIDPRLQALAGKATTLKVNFTNAELAELASIFASIINDSPAASRKERAKRFSEAILTRKGLKKVFGKISKAEMEQMCVEIADVLDSSPVFGQLVDDVTDGASKSAG